MKPKKAPSIPEKMPSWAGALIDHFDAKFDLLVDGLAALDRRIDERIEELRREMNMRFAEVEVRFDAIEDRLDRMDERFDQYGQQFEVMFEELHGFRQASSG